MKNLLLLLLLSQLTVAQKSWFENNTIRYYGNPTDPFKYGFDPGMDYLRSNIIGDTVIAGKTCKIFEIRFCSSFKVYCHEYVYEHQDSVFYYNYNSQSFHLLYNFNAKAGDTVWVHRNSFKPTKGFFQPVDIKGFGYRIDSVYTKTFSGQNIYKVQKASNIDPETNNWGFPENVK